MITEDVLQSWRPNFIFAFCFNLDSSEVQAFLGVKNIPLHRSFGLANLRYINLPCCQNARKNLSSRGLNRSTDDSINKSAVEPYFLSGRVHFHVQTKKKSISRSREFFLVSNKTHLFSNLFFDFWNHGRGWKEIYASNKTCSFARTSGHPRLYLLFSCFIFLCLLNYDFWVSQPDFYIFNKPFTNNQNHSGAITNEWKMNFRL